MKRINRFIAAVALVALTVGASAQERGTIEPAGYLYGRLSRLMEVAIQGDYAYIADMHNGLQVYDVTNPSLPALAGYWNDSPGWGTSVCVSDQYAYLVEGQAVRVIDISDPHAPTLTGSWVSQDGGWMMGVAVQGNYVYAADEFLGLRVIDVSDPTDPVQVATYETFVPGSEASTGIATVMPYGDDILYAAMMNRGMWTFDVSDPLHPALLSTLESSNFICDLELSGNCVYAASRGDGLFVFEIQEDNSLQEIAHVNLEGYSGGVEVAGIYAYVVSGMGSEDPMEYGRIDIFDVSDPATPEVIGSTEIPRWGNDLGLVNGHAIVATEYSALVSVGISDPTEPWLDAVVDEFGTITDVSLSGNLAILADWQKGLAIVDVSDPDRPYEVSRCIGLNGVASVASDANYAYVVSANEGLSVVSLTRGVEHPIVASAPLQDIPVSIAIDGRYAYVALEWLGMQVFDISDPARPTAVALHREERYIEALSYSNGTVCLAIRDFEGSLDIVDVSDPTSPQLVSRLAESFLSDVTQLGTRAAIVTSSGFEREARLTIIDLADNVNPSVMGSVAVTSGAKTVALEGNYAYVADIFYGLSVFDISDASNPVEVAASTSRSPALRMVVRDKRMYVAAGYTFEIFNFEEGNEVKPVSGNGGGANGSDLVSAYPNPFNSVTRLGWSAPASSPVKISVFNVTGAKVIDLYDGAAPGGRSETLFEANDLPAGAYMIRLDAGGKTITKTVRLVR